MVSPSCTWFIGIAYFWKYEYEQMTPRTMSLDTQDQSGIPWPFLNFSKTKHSVSAQTLDDGAAMIWSSCGQ